MHACTRGDSPNDSFCDPLCQEVAGDHRIQVDARAHGRGDDHGLDVAALGARRLDAQQLGEQRAVVLGELLRLEAGLAENDVAIVFTENGDYILCVMCMSPFSNNSAIEQIVSISHTVYTAYMEE